MLEKVTFYEQREVILYCYDKDAIVVYRQDYVLNLAV